jgi:tetratricopeptide (TPR) repeat protein
MKTCEEIYKDIQPLIDKGRHEDAIGALEKLLDSYPDFAQGHNDLGILYFHLGDKEKALYHHRESVNLQPDNTSFLKNLADFFYTEMKNVNDALKYYRKIINVQPADVETLMITGNLCVAEHRFDEAKGWYKKILEIEPWNDKVLSNLNILESTEQSSTNEQSPEEVHQRSQELFSSGNAEGAIEELEKLLKINPEFALAHNDLGVMHYNIGNKDKTLRHYEEAVRLEPNDLNFQKNLADFYCVELGRIEDALEIYLKILTEEPTDIETLMAAGHICEAFDRKEDAKIFYDRVLDIEPWNLEANDNLNQLNPAQTDNKDILIKNQM